ncbi:GTP cyclohydrolase 1 [Cercospora beticola]|uniref:GTP cyclohydrolase 1 n=1 Tax=Cercospora beticola TaxID=122368 RepID=A0A2G5IEY2_CERBT|nr:GTP cyclohydrolase 1 [Cercospora beticola]PIB03023.1 GTP cyclohydrolase 1 [Cercospora beticola]WPB04303.1 GTP cyclohydrolase 1 [Cercospora beticola]CAK1356881.1 unnamed protein product [Cercospora beticola]
MASTDNFVLTTERLIEHDNTVASVRGLDSHGLSTPEHSNCIQNIRAESAEQIAEVTNPLLTRSSFFEVDRLRQPSSGSESFMGGESEHASKRLEKMRGAVRTLLECVGENPDREGLLATPSRYAEALLFLTQGYRVDVESIVNKALFREAHHEMVIVKDIEIHSMCEHHLVPFIGKMHIGYIPNGVVIGLSKLPRIAEMFSRRLQIQERLTKQVAYTVNDIVKPQGVGVVMESCHLCMVMRGVEKTGTSTITSCVLGCFDELKTRNEFLSLIGVARA